MTVVVFLPPSFFFSALRLRQHPARFLGQQLVSRHWTKTDPPNEEKPTPNGLGLATAASADAIAVAVKTGGGGGHEAAEARHPGQFLPNGYTSRLIVELGRFVSWLPSTSLLVSPPLPTPPSVSSAPAAQPAAFNGVLLPCCPAMETPPEHLCCLQQSI